MIMRRLDRYRYFLLPWAVVGSMASNLVAVEPGTQPAARFYKGREIARTMHYTGAPWLVRPSREREEDCDAMLASLAIRPGQTVCDIGCGNGFYTLRLARMVGTEGKVLAVDIQPQMLDLLRSRAKQAAIENVVPILGTAVNPKLPLAAIDLVLMVDVYHEMSHPAAMLRAIRRSLKPTGRMVLVEFRAEDPAVPIKRLHKMSKPQILKEVVPNGFRLVRQFDDLPWQHVMSFQRDQSR